MRTAGLLLSILLLTTAALAASAPAAGTVTWWPQAIASGSPCLFRVDFPSAPSQVHATWHGHSLAFSAAADGHRWYALAGVDVEAKPGTYLLEIDAMMPDGSEERVQREVAVGRAMYKTEVLRLPQKFVKPDAESLALIEADRQAKKVAFAREVPQPEWSGNFEVPVSTKPSEGFGTRRTFNGQLASIHRGMDYHAAPGTPVLAANSGVVVLARALFYEGNCVIINHGQQFMTIYMHLSHLSVKEGDNVEKGQEVGLSGSTGRSTGPHLHVAVRWQDAYLDPAQLWTLPLPNLPATAEPKASGASARK